MNIKSKKNYDIMTISFDGELDECSALSAKEILDKIISNNKNIKKYVFDLSGLSFMDSTGIGLLIGRYKKLKSSNIESYIKNNNFTVEKVLEVSGLYTIMPKI